MLKFDNDTPLDIFVDRFLKHRYNWWTIPKLGITNFGNIISMLMYRQPPFQVELFIVPFENSHFTMHKHPDVDVYEFGLSGDSVLYVNSKPVVTAEQTAAWLCGLLPSVPIHISPNDWHYGYGKTAYSFLSLQKWLHNVQLSSVGLNWSGLPSSVEQAQMLSNKQ